MTSGFAFRNVAQYTSGTQHSGQPRSTSDDEGHLQIWCTAVHAAVVSRAV